MLDHIAQVGARAFSHHLLKPTQFRNKKCPDNVIAIAHDDDLQLVKEVVRLRSNQDTVSYPINNQ